MPLTVRPRLLRPSLQLVEGTDVAMEEIQIPNRDDMRYGEGCAEASHYSRGADRTICPRLVKETPAFPL